MKNSGAAAFAEDYPTQKLIQKWIETLTHKTISTITLTGTINNLSRFIIKL